MELMGDIIVGYDFLLFADDTVRQNKGNKKTEDVQTPLFCYNRGQVVYGAQVWRAQEHIPRVIRPGDAEVFITEQRRLHVLRLFVPLVLPPVLRR